ncbi:hypothetical protein Bbelb_071580 [Branchiostoma belcheri]|nr:hypothetical protein Bbelb_071580 [Branchiostoma belcheri]
MRVYRSLLPPKCTKEHLRENSDEHNMTTKRSHRPPCVLTAHCSHRSVPKNTSERTITPPAMCAYRSLLPPKCIKEHLRENSDEHNMTTKRSHRPPCVSTAHCSHRSVPKNTSERTVTNTT